MYMRLPMADLPITERPPEGFTSLILASLVRT